VEVDAAGLKTDSFGYFCGAKKIGPDEYSQKLPCSLLGFFPDCIGLDPDFSADLTTNSLRKHLDHFLFYGDYVLFGQFFSHLAI
jgi:hypothetical protein